MAGTTSRAVTIAAKYIGGAQVKRESVENADAIDHLGNTVRSTDDRSRKAGGGWSFFSKKTDEAGKSAKRTGGLFHGLGKSLLGMGLAMGGGLLALSTVKSSIDSVEEKAREVRQAQAIGIGENSTQTMSILSAYKARGIGMSQLGMTMKMLAKSSYTAEQQEGKHAKAGAHAAEQRARQIEQYDRAVSKVKAGGVMPLPLGKPHEVTELGTKAKAYQSLGIVVSSFRKLSGTQQLEKIGEALTKMPIGPERTRLATEMLGRSATKMLPAFEKGEGNVLVMRKYAEEAYAKIGDTGAAGMEKFHIQQMKMGIDMEAMKLQIGMFMLPIMSKLVKGFTDLYRSISSGRGIWGPIKEGIKWMVGAVVTVVEWFKRTEWAAKGLLVVLGFLSAAWAVEKVIKFYKALKALWLVQKLIGVFRLAAGGIALMGDAEVVAAGETMGMSGALVGMQAGLVAIMAPLAIFAGALAGILGVAEATSRILGKGSFVDNLKEALSGQAWIAKTEKEQDALTKGSVHASHQLLAARRAHPHWRWEAAHHKKFPKLGDGGYIRHSGWAIVGDRGPEGIHLPQGATVDPLTSRGRGPQGIGGAFQSAGGDLHVHVQVDRREIAQAVLKDFRQRGARA